MEEKVGNVVYVASDGPKSAALFVPIDQYRIVKI